MAFCYPDSTDWSCIGGPAEIAALDGATKDKAEMFAWAALSRLTGFRLSLCPIVIRPCAARCNPRVWEVAPVGILEPFQPFMMGGRWFNSCGCRDASSCSCTIIREIILPTEASGPITVTIDGAVLDSDAYRIDDGTKLVRQDGEPWPWCQDMNLPEGEVGTMEVSFYPGIGPNDLLNGAAGLLAAEYYKSCQGNDCRLPANVTQVVRQGVTIQIAADSFGSGLTGIREIDDVIAIYNPYRLKTPPRVWSPDRRHGRVRTY